MTLSTQRTLFNVDLHLAMLLGANYTCLPHTTLNEKWGVSNEHIADQTRIKKMSAYPTIRYLTIGTGGSPGINNSKGFIYSEHGPLDACLFDPIPFIMVKKGENFPTNLSENNYRFKVEETVNGVTYNSYYLRCIENLDKVYDNKFQKITNVGGETFISTLNTDTNMLAPDPNRKELKYDKIKETEFVTKLCKMKVTFTAPEIDELRHVYEIRGDGKHMLTEMGICTGIEIYLDDDGSNKLLEPIDVQIMFYLDLNLDLTYSFNQSQPFTKYIELGGAEPYFGPKNEEETISG